MSYFKDININQSQIGVNATGAIRTAEARTLFDGKILNEDNPLLFDNQGTGTGTYANNKYNMSVTSGQYRIRQSLRYINYFSGKSQMIECTFDNFQVEANTVKRVGYFSSNATAPYDSTYDGFYLENDGTTIRLKADRAGTNTINVAWTSWDNYNLISGYNWANFTVIAFDFLWLGGSALRIFIKTNLGWVLAHTHHYAGTTTDTFILSPNQPIRYEIRSTTGTGSFRYVCSDVIREGGVDERGVFRFVDTGNTGISTATVGTTYPLKAVRSKTTHRDICKQVSDWSCLITSADEAKITIQRNPTLSAPLTFTDVANSSFQEATGNGTITVTAAGTILEGTLVSQSNNSVSDLEDNYYAIMGQTLDNVRDEIYLCITPLSATITSFAALHTKEY